VSVANNILIIENDPKTLDLITETLEKLGASVFTATSADLGISMSQKINPSLILVNLATPGANGLEICKKLHAEEAIEKIPIFLLTMRAGKFDPDYTKLYGIRGFLKKPLDPTTLLSEIQNYLPIGEHSGPGAVLSDVEDEMALPDELKETLIQAKPGEAPPKEHFLEPATDSIMHQAEPEEKSEITPMGLDLPDEEPKTASPGFGPSDEGPGKNPFEDAEDKELDELLSGETTKVKLQPEIKEKTSLKKESKISKRILIPAILLPILIVIAVSSYFFLMPKTPTLQKAVPQKTVPSKMPKQVDIKLPEVDVEPDIKVETPMTEEKKAPETARKTTVAVAEKKVTAPSKPNSTTAFYVQFGTFTSKENANQLVKQLKLIGLDTFIKTSRAKNGSPSYRVLLDKEFGSLDLARNESHKIKKTHRVDSFPYSNYYVQFGTFTSKENANQLVKQLKLIGLDTFIIISRAKNGSPSYRVLLDKEFGSLDLARNESRKIKKIHRVDSFPYSETVK
jgi:CheY-like chemotaxis protein/cell division septation protein DedD